MATYDGGNNATAIPSGRTFDGGITEEPVPPPLPSVPEILSRKVIAADCEYITNASNPLLIDAITYADNTLSGESTRHMLANAATAQPFLYATQNHAGGIYVRRHDHLLPGIDLSCISPWNSNNANFRGGTLITPQHVAIATHYPIPVGATIRFVSMNNVVVDRVITASNITRLDVRILTLASPVPATIKPALGMPTDWQDYLGPTFVKTTGLFITDQQERLVPCAYIGAPGQISGVDSIRYDIPSFNASYFTSLNSQFRRPISGDSGNSMFMVIKDQVVALASIHTPAGGDAIYDKMHFIDPITSPYKMKLLDLSGFVNYA